MLSLLSLTAQGRGESWVWRVKGAGWNQQPQQGEHQCWQVGRGGPLYKEKHLISIWGSQQRTFGGSQWTTWVRYKKKSQKLFFPLLVSAPCSAASAPCHRQGRGYTAAQALSLPAQLQPGLGRVCLFTVWHCTEWQETGRFLLKRKMRSTPQRWPLNKENYLNF